MLYFKAIVSMTYFIDFLYIIASSYSTPYFFRLIKIFQAFLPNVL